MNTKTIMFFAFFVGMISAFLYGVEIHDGQFISTGGLFTAIPGVDALGWTYDLMENLRDSINVMYQTACSGSSTTPGSCNLFSKINGDIWADAVFILSLLWELGTILYTGVLVFLAILLFLITLFLNALFPVSFYGAIFSLVAPGLGTPFSVILAGGQGFMMLWYVAKKIYDIIP